MRPLVPRLAAAVATMLAVVGVSARPAHGDRIIETVYGAPVTYYAPTSYVTTSRVYPASDVYYAPTSYSYVTPASYSYVVPTSYRTASYGYLPASYVTTSAYTLAPTYYATTYYRRPGLLRRLANRPVYETTYRYAYDAYPTTLHAPTTIAYDPTYTTTSLAYLTGCVETAVPFEPPAAAPVNDTAKSITSVPKNNGEPVFEGDAGAQRKAAAKAKPKDAGVSPPDAGGLSEPSDEPPPKGAGDSIDRTSFRPQFKDIQPRQGSAARAVLRGEVVSGVTRDPKANFQVVFTDLRGRFADKTKPTDAKGAFEIFLPDGSWSYRVVDPADTKNAKEYGQITVTSGQYLDEADAPIYGLRLNY